VSTFLADVADAAAPVAVGLLIGAAAARIARERLDHARARDVASRYLERRDRVGLVGYGGILRWLRPLETWIYLKLRQPPPRRGAG